MMRAWERYGAIALLTAGAVLIYTCVKYPLAVYLLLTLVGVLVLLIGVDEWGPRVR